MTWRSALPGVQAACGTYGLLLLVRPNSPAVAIPWIRGHRIHRSMQRKRPVARLHLADPKQTFGDSMEAGAVVDQVTAQLDTLTDKAADLAAPILEVHLPQCLHKTWQTVPKISLFSTV